MRSTMILPMAVFALAVSAGSVLADHKEPGVPGEPNCHGQQLAYALEIWRDMDPPVRGLGNIANQAGVSVAEIQGNLRDYCELDDDDDDDDGDNG